MQPDRMVDGFLERSAELYPDKVAIVYGNQRISYREMDEMANRQAHALIHSGVARGDRVAIYLDNSIEAAAALFGTLKAGAVFLMVNPSTKADKLAYILGDSGAKAIVTTDRKSATVGTTATTVVLPEDSGQFPSYRPPRRCIDIDLAALIYTSGSTGMPKGVMMTHLNMVSAATSITTFLENTPDDIILCVLPLSFNYGLYQLLMAFKIGGTLVLEKSFVYPYAVIETMIREKVTGFPIVPTITAILLQLDLTRIKVPALRYITNTAAALPTSHITRLRAIFPSVKIFAMYGLTECKRVSYLPPDQIDIRPESVGRGMPNCEFYLIDGDGRRVSNGAMGEMVVRGANVMKGYWRRPEETAKVLRPGSLPGETVLHTGDFFRTDEEGYLYFVGRKDDIIRSRGEKVSPREIETVLCGIPGVAEAAVIGVPDAVLGQAVKAFVALNAGALLTPRDIVRGCAAKLEDYMVPQIIEIVDALPKLPSGKLDKKALADTK